MYAYLSRVAAASSCTVPDHFRPLTQLSSLPLRAALFARRLVLERRQRLCLFLCMPCRHRFWANSSDSLGSLHAPSSYKNHLASAHPKIRKDFGLCNGRRKSLLDLVQLLIHRCKLCRRNNRRLHSEGMSHEIRISDLVYGDNIHVPIRNIQRLLNPFGVVRLGTSWQDACTSAAENL